MPVSHQADRFLKVAQQTALRAAFLVDQAIQEKQVRKLLDIVFRRY